LYFLLQSCSGHSSSTGEIAHGTVVLFVLVVEILTFNPVTGLTRLWVPGVRPPPALEDPFADDVVVDNDELLIVMAVVVGVAQVDVVLLLLLPFTDGDGLSSFDFLFSGRGGKNAIGDVDGVLDVVFVVVELLADEFAVDAVVVVVVFVVLVVVAVVRPPLPLAPPFLSLLCTCNFKVVQLSSQNIH
jgi:hypothetical protein